MAKREVMATAPKGSACGDEEETINRALHAVGRQRANNHSVGLVMPGERRLTNPINCVVAN
ncbi:MAG: hypothetical protein V3S73_02345 [Gammaproteobacteria bacterium]